jgi:hypothetical protein
MNPNIIAIIPAIIPPFNQGLRSFHVIK